MKRFLWILILIVPVSVINGCYYDVEEELYPATGAVCDTSNVTYTLTVKPILDQNCNVCHSNASQQGSVILDSYADVAAQASSGKLMGAITHDPQFSAMPQGGAMLNDCNILKIGKWVQEGSPNN